MIVYKRLLRISEAETLVATRGFLSGTEESVLRREAIGRYFLYGYHTVLDTSDHDSIRNRLDDAPDEFRGFAFEGAAMCMALLDSLSLSRPGRFGSFLAKQGSEHVYMLHMLHVGVGWAMARLPWLRWRAKQYLRQFDSLYSWLVVDGFGFHEGYFHWPNQFKRRMTVPANYFGRAFDQGLGRSLWFVMACDVKEAASAIECFPLVRQRDLWRGVGLAIAYAGGASEQDLRTLIGRAATFRPALAQGVAFAAKARLRAGNPVSHTELACRCLWSQRIDDVARVTDDAARDVHTVDGDPAYEVWRQRIEAEFDRRIKE